MNKLRAAKGYLKDHHRFLADEIDDYAEQPDDYDAPISYFLDSQKKSQSQKEIALKKTIASKKTAKMTSRWPKFKPDFNLEVASEGIFDKYFGENLAKYLTISDLVKLLQTCRYLYKMFSKTVIWINYLEENFGYLYLSKDTLSKINIIQYAKYLKCASNVDKTFFRKDEKIKAKNNGIVFDTVIMAKNMKKDEEKLLARNVVDFVTAKSQKTIDTINKLTKKGTLTGDLKISWIKEMNRVSVWVADYQVQNETLCTFAGILLQKEYESVKNTYFLNDRYFVIETEENFEVFAIEPEDGWFEKKEQVFCKRVLKESFMGKIKIKNVGDFVVFLLEGEKNKLSFHVFDLNNGNDKFVKDFCLDAGLDDIIVSKTVTKSSFSIYLLDKELDVYLMSYSHESGVTFKKFDQKGEKCINMTFLSTVKKYHYGTYHDEVQNKTSEYLMICKEKRFYLLKFDTNDLVLWSLPYYSYKESKLFNWTICENLLYLLNDTTLQIYKLNIKDGSAVQKKMEIIYKIHLERSTACWIFVNPCMTILMTAGSLDEYLNSSIQLLIVSTQRLLMNPDFYREIHFDECRLDKILEDIASIECKFEDERFLIQETNGRSYFRDFNVYEQRVEREKYRWKVQTKYDLDELSIVSTEYSKEDFRKKVDHWIFPAEVKPQPNKIEKIEKRFATKEFFVFENKNHENSKKKGNQNWKNIEKKAETDEKLEKKESRKKGEKYFKNVRQGKHLQKMSD